MEVNIHISSFACRVNCSLFSKTCGIAQLYLNYKRYYKAWQLEYV